MTPQQRQNLAKLCLYVHSLPPNYSHFDMKYFCHEIGNKGAEKCIPSFQHKAHPIDVNACGTSACFAGHGPLAGILPLEGEKWIDYTLRNFSSGQTKSGNTTYGEEFTWLFGENWHNSISDAIKRAAYFLQNDWHPDVEESEEWNDDKEMYEPFYVWDEPDGWSSFAPDFDLIRKIAEGSELSVTSET